MSFRLVLTTAQKDACNAYLHTPKDYCWLRGEITDFDDIIEFSVTTSHCINFLEEDGWHVYQVDD